MPAFVVAKRSGPSLPQFFAGSFGHKTNFFFEHLTEVADEFTGGCPVGGPFGPFGAVMQIPRKGGRDESVFFGGEYVCLWLQYFFQHWRLLITTFLDHFFSIADILIQNQSFMYS